MSKQDTSKQSNSLSTSIDLSTDSQDIRLVRIINTETLSGLSTLEVHFGFAVSNPTDLYIRIWLNSGNGLFSRQWVSLDEIYGVLAKAEKHFNASALNPIGLGMSANNPSFIGAGILAENLIQRSSTSARSYVLNDWSLWRQEMAKLIETKPEVSATPIPKIVKKRKRSTAVGEGVSKAEAASASAQPVG